MCKSIEDYGDEREKKGKIEGKIEEKIHMAWNLYKQGVDEAVIAKAAGVEVADVQEWFSTVPT